MNYDYVISIDYSTNSTVLLLGKVDKSNKRIIFIDCDWQFFRTDNEIYKSIKELAKTVNNQIDIIIDPSAASLIELIKSKREFAVNPATL